MPQRCTLSSQVYGSGYKEALLSEKAGSSGATVKGIMKTLGALHLPT